ncbi:serine hydrolase domain-containing protein [Streptomyces sp. NBC_00344]|uniref:serine hydrolase domain-containing protein n=1 Tax=Streptomyces sp. NBC_00344 TaxID=2975720 RepID=UPI002E24000B
MELRTDRLSGLGDYFGRLTDEGRIPGWSCMVSQYGETTYESAGGMANIAAGIPMQADSIFRTWSLSKPMTSVAFMTLVEKGLVGLNDPVADYLPAFENLRVYRAGLPAAPITEGLVEPMRIWHLLTHTSGLGYGAHQSHAVDTLYVNEGYTVEAPPGADLAEAVEKWASFPLRFQPGTAWNYGVSTDVLGRVIEVISGKRLDVYMKESLFEPLGLHDTDFRVDASKKDRYAEIYSPTADGIEHNAPASVYNTDDPVFMSGGGGIYTTVADYMEFLGMLANNGRIRGTSDYVLSPLTVESVRSNHLPGNVPLGAGFGTWPVPAVNELMPAAGFGLGFMTVVSPQESHMLTREGEYFWLSMSSSNFFVDPASGVAALISPQLYPSRTLPITNRLRQFVYQAYC